MCDKNFTPNAPQSPDIWPLKVREGCNFDLRYTEWIISENIFSLIIIITSKRIRVVQIRLFIVHIDQVPIPGLLKLSCNEADPEKCLQMSASLRPSTDNSASSVLYTMSSHGGGMGGRLFGSRWG
ncbi:unnamed protein product [Sphagnum balticum]